MSPTSTRVMLSGRYQRFSGSEFSAQAQRSSLLALGVAIPAISAHSDENQDATRTRIVQEFVQAYNDRDLETLLSLTDDQIEWPNIAGKKIVPESTGKLALYEGLEAYFDANPTSKSTLEWTRVAGSRVTAHERASWTGANGEQSQFSLSVYEFKGELIRRVYYYPAEWDEPALR